MVFDEEYEANRLKELKLWLAENVIDIPAPQEVTLFDFEINWSKWSGDFKVRFDEFECQDTFGLAMEMTGFPKFYFPMFTSPLGVPASYRAIEITYQSPVESRLSKEAIEETRTLVVEDYSVSVRLDDLNSPVAQ
jgi:hypothetical protein